MPMPAPAYGSDEEHYFTRLFMLAYRAGPDGVTAQFSTSTHAVQCRLQIYTWRKRVLAHTIDYLAHGDGELIPALNACQVQIIGKDKTSLRVSRRVFVPWIAELAQSLGDDPSQVDNAAAAAMAERIAQTLKSPPASVASPPSADGGANPFDQPLITSDEALRQRVADKMAAYLGRGGRE